MYLDQFYNAISKIIILILLPLFFVIKRIGKEMSYERFLRIRPWISVIIYLLISGFLCTVTLFKIKYVGTLIDILILSLCAFVYSLTDVFYFQEVKKEHVWNLQNQFIEKGNMDSLFEEITIRGVYLQKKESEKEKYSVIETENDGQCIFVDGTVKRALKPKKEMPTFLLRFYAKCLSLNMEEIPVFSKEDNLEKIIKNYQFFKPSCIYLWIRKHWKAIKRIILVASIVLFVGMFFYLVAGSQNWFGIQDWMNQEIN